jgi:putative endonuclease
MQYHTYILYSVNFNRYYIGHCEDLTLRLVRHNNKQVPSTKPYVPWIMVYSESYVSRQEANARELYIKRMKSRKYIEQLLNSPK